MKTVHGFSPITLIIIIVVIGTAAGISWLVFNKQDKPVKSSTSTSQTSNTSSSGTLKIPELGIKLQLGAGVEDAVYEITADGTYGISTKKFEAIDPNCAASAGKVARIVAFTDPHAIATDVGTGDHSYKDSFPTAVLVGGAYYDLDYTKIAQGPCFPASSADTGSEPGYGLMSSVTQGLKSTQVLAL